MIRVLVVDDQELVRSGFRIILESEPDIEVVGEASDGAEAVALAAETAPDVICMDVEMPVMNGIEATRRILAGAGRSVAERATAASRPHHRPAEDGGHGRPAVLILTTFGHENYLFEALAAGVSGFLLKTSRAEQLIDAVRTLAHGQALLGPDVTRAVMLRAASPTAAGPATQTQTRPAQASAGNGGTGEGAADPSPAGRPAPSSAEIAAMDRAGLTEREREVLALVAAGRSNGEIAAELFLGEATVKTHVSNLLQKMGARDRIQLIVWAHTGRGPSAA
ncbi:response regulator [Leucobacter ruminantium]|uniref:Response regulator transcription factor n=1 Tax=Leucobacter ruminantium TaxID=1289170 RepID=A0A939RWU1_9MICO|nr:response regulator transcription factor [Leucobacter ruminantium]MBO1805402.1 response regulator transcription factor [Leucobacter ruminantium]